MPRYLLRPFRVALVFAAQFLALRAAEPTRSHVTDPTHLLPHDSSAVAPIEQKLASFEQAHRVSILVEFHAKSPPPDEDKVPGVYMRTLATQLGLEQHGVLAVYFADEDDWRLWIGDDLTAVFAGRPGTAQELTKNHAIHDAKEALFAAAHAESEAAFAKLTAAAPPAHPPTAAQRVELQAEAILDRLIARLGPK